MASGSALHKEKCYTYVTQWAREPFTPERNSSVQQQTCSPGVTMVKHHAVRMLHWLQVSGKCQCTWEQVRRSSAEVSDALRLDLHWRSQISLTWPRLLAAPEELGVKLNRAYTKRRKDPQCNLQTFYKHLEYFPSLSAGVAARGWPRSCRTCPTDSVLCLLARSLADQLYVDRAHASPHTEITLEKNWRWREKPLPKCQLNLCTPEEPPSSDTHHLLLVFFFFKAVFHLLKPQTEKCRLWMVECCSKSH